MRFNIALALCISVLLVGGATWIRFSPSTSNTEAGLVAVETDREALQNYFDEEVLPILEKGAIPASKDVSTPKPLTGTDMVGRQLLTDYIQLASTGQASQKDILALAENYVDSIPTLSSAPAITYAELTLGQNDKASLQKYADSLTLIYNSYASAMRRAESNMGSGPTSSDFYSFAGRAAIAYQGAADKLRALKTPSILAQAHLGLTNYYLAASASMKTISQTEDDPASAFAGLLAISESVREEKGLWKDVQYILNSNGI